METIFDHNVTDKEQRLLLGFVYQKDELLAANESQSWHNATLYRLYGIRGDKQMQQKFLDMIPNNIYKFFELTNHDFAK